MKNSIGYLLAFVGGVGCGVTGTYVVCKRAFDLALEKEIKDFKKEYRGSRANDILSKDEAAKEPEEESDKTYKEEIGIPEKLRTRVDMEYTDYTKIRSNYVKPEIMPDETPEDVLAKAEHPEDGDEEDIRLISLDEFMSDMTFDKETILWYTEDDVLTDLFGDVFDDTLPLVGECLTNINYDGDSGDEDKSVFIRNEPLGIDYEVQIITAKHADMIE